MHTRTHTHTHTCTHAHPSTHTKTHTCLAPMPSLTHTHDLSLSLTHTHTHIHAQTRMHIQEHPHTVPSENISMDQPVCALSFALPHTFPLPDRHTQTHTVLLENVSIILSGRVRALSLSFPLFHTLFLTYTRTYATYTIPSKILSIYLSARAHSLVLSSTLSLRHTHAHTQLHSPIRKFVHFSICARARSPIHTHLLKIPLISPCIHLRALSLTHRSP